MKKLRLILIVLLVSIMAASSLFFITNNDLVNAATLGKDGSSVVSVDTATAVSSFSLPNWSGHSSDILYVSVVSYGQYVSGVSDTSGLTWACRQAALPGR